MVFDICLIGSNVEVAVGIIAITEAALPLLNNEKGIYFFIVGLFRCVCVFYLSIDTLTKL